MARGKSKPKSRKTKVSPPKPVLPQRQPRKPNLETLRAHLKARDFLSAAALAEQVTAAHPNEPLVWLMLTEARRGLGDEAAALESARHLVEIAPEESWAHQLHALLAKRQEHFDEAESAYRRALELAPDDAESHCNLASVLSGTGRHDEALVHLRRAIALQPDFAQAHTNLGAILTLLGQETEGLAAQQRAIELNPNSAVAQDNLGATLTKLKRYQEAEQAHRRALAFDPRFAQAYYNLGHLLLGKGAFDEAEVAFRQTIRYQPKHQDAQDRLLSMQAYLGTAPPVALRRESERWERALLSDDERRAAREHRFHRALRTDRRLRLGILSAELGQHPVAYFLLPWLRELDRSRFELYLYSTTDRSNQSGNAEFRALAERWRSLVDLTDTQAVRSMRQDRLDILLETSGHTSDNRLGIVARRVAPVQCHYIGYYATTGLSEMDYLLGDEVLIPPEHDEHFTEKVWRLPRTRYVYSPIEQAPAPRWIPSPDGQPRLGSFNDLIKIRTASLSLWARVLKGLPGARLVLKDRRQDDYDSRVRILSSLKRLGIGAGRVDFLPHVASWAEHMAQYNSIDVALDSVPFNSATTAFDALWMGTPLVTLLGDRLSARQAASCLTGLGRDEWIATSDVDYIDKVVSLVRDLDQRRSIRKNQRARMLASELCDAPGLARALEQSFVRMCDRGIGGFDGERLCSSDRSRAEYPRI